jgi:hypothetical protein
MLNRFFGTGKAKPKATLNDAISGTDARVDSVEVKIKKLDAELVRYRDQMAKMKEGPGKVNIGGLDGTQTELARPGRVLDERTVSGSQPARGEELLLFRMKREDFYFGQSRESLVDALRTKSWNPSSRVEPRSDLVK